MGEVENRYECGETVEDLRSSVFGGSATHCEDRRMPCNLARSALSRKALVVLVREDLRDPRRERGAAIVGC